MKKILWILAGLTAVAVAVWYLFIRTGKIMNPLSQVNTGTAKAPPTYANLWGLATNTALNNAAGQIADTLGWLNTISNSFGKSDGGNSPAPISGSNRGGVFTTGSGAANPVDSAKSIITDSWFDYNFDGTGTNPIYA
jgi:hypothetical protein